ncbi:hypothetical protein [Vibrio tetraodonis]|uniref:hypothetical protein n=1 Tax=Vibrio tetraodonis TaxID=2231647 RepID=UPI000E0A6636|nr:hypothetical protein [Vibrio tetraodonis]
MMVKRLTIIGLLVLLAGCLSEKPVSVSKISQSGSLGAPQFIRDMWITDIYGGVGNFAYGGVQGCCASASVGMGVPTAIEGSWESGWGGGYWAEEWKRRWKPEWGNYDDVYDKKWYRIDGEIDSELAKQKIDTMNRYYKNHKANPVMQVLVDGPKVILLYRYICNSERPQNDCTVRDNADPNGWVKPAPYSKYGNIMSVVLYEGTGETSDKPFEG